MSVCVFGGGGGKGYIKQPIWTLLSALFSSGLSPHVVTVTSSASRWFFLVRPIYSGVQYQSLNQKYLTYENAIFIVCKIFESQLPKISPVSLSLLVNLVSKYINFY